MCTIPCVDQSDGEVAGPQPVILFHQDRLQWSNNCAKMWVYNCHVIVAKVHYNTHYLVILDSFGDVYHKEVINSGIEFICDETARAGCTVRWTNTVSGDNKESDRGNWQTIAFPVISKTSSAKDAKHKSMQAGRLSSRE
ncbi:hypothetical protein NM688_g5513 [Phlebia brevispora]|uniref:Uncharacterized protein n=1 Tax=Phlebia brevispora TaxID=194682 RepID=A0ACC1SU99_9APHY|nr:hypothetical protein NM688_g5513 [Phlebia brevispora]